MKENTVCCLLYVGFTHRTCNRDHTGLSSHYLAVLGPIHIERKRKFSLTFEIILPPAKEVCKSCVFTGVCLSTGGGGSLSSRISVWRGFFQGDHTPPLQYGNVRGYASYWNTFLSLIFFTFAFAWCE